MLIRSSLIHSFTKIAQHKWANVSNSLRSLRSTERLWANCSSRSWQMSEYEWFAQFTQDKWANERIARLFWASHSFSLSLRKNEWFNKKIKNIVFFVHFLQLFWNFLKKKKIRSFLLSKVRELLRSLRTNEWPWAICSGHSEGMSNHERIAQVAHQKFSKWVNHSLFEQIAHSLTFWQKRGFTPKFDERIPNQEKLEMKRNSKIIC